MIVPQRAAATLLASALLLGSCTGGSEGTAAEEPTPKKNSAAAQAAGNGPAPDVRASLTSINSSIPVYANATYREDLTRRDEVMIRNQYGPNARVYTLASDDSYPQVYHFYLTYLAQFRAFPSQLPYPSSNRNWRTWEVNLNDAMQDSFIPGTSMRPGANNVILQIAETEAEPQTVIRYIVRPPEPVAPMTAVITPGATEEPVALQEESSPSAIR